MRRHLFAFIVAGAAGFPCISGAQTSRKAAPLPTVPFRLALDDSLTSAPIAGATVEILSKGASQRTDDRGTVRFKDVPIGFQRIRIRAVGYRPVETFISVTQVAENDNTATLVDLTPSVATLPASQVTEAGFRLRQDPDGFDARRRQALGRFILDTTFQRESQRPPADVIAEHAPGIVSYQSLEGRHVLMTAAGKNVISIGSGPATVQCPVDVFVNGVHQSDNFSIDDYQSFDISAVEVYTASSIPIQFKRTTNDGSSGRQECGVLVIWTRR